MHSGKNLKDKHMNKSIEDLKPVLTLALEALEFDGFTPEDATHRYYTTKATAAIREALAHAPTEREQPAQQRHISYVCPQCYWSLEEHPAPMAEPHKQQSAERVEPVLWLVNGVVQVSDIPKDYTGCLFTSPPANANAGKPWVGLTKEDRYKAIRPLYNSDENARLAVEHSNDEYEALEDKLRERNEYREKNA